MCNFDSGRSVQGLEDAGHSHGRLGLDGRDDLSASPRRCSAEPPRIAEPHITLEEMARRLGATALHKRGVTGKGVRIAVIDKGYSHHPYFDEHGMHHTHEVRPGIQQYTLNQDASGHGTAMAAVLSSVAPGAVVTVYSGHINECIDHIISNKTADIISTSYALSWCAENSPNNDPVARLEALRIFKGLVERATAANIILCDAVGNAGSCSLLSLIPGVISVGGVYSPENEPGELEVSSYTNAYALDTQTAVIEEAARERQLRKEKEYGLLPLNAETLASKGEAIEAIETIAKPLVPDICGLSGPAGHTDYILLPVPPGSEHDGDNLKAHPGWCLASGSSCATPQVAAVCALLREGNPEMTAETMLRILGETATPVDRGESFQKMPADPTTWSRLVNADDAVKQARGD